MLIAVIVCLFVAGVLIVVAIFVSSILFFVAVVTVLAVIVSLVLAPFLGNKNYRNLRY